MGTTQRTNMYNPLSCKTQTANTLYKALAPKDYVRYYALLAPKIILKKNVADSWNHFENKCVQGFHQSDVIM